MEALGFLPLSGLIVAIIAIVFGIIMLVKPQIVAYLIGAYLTPKHILNIQKGATSLFARLGLNLAALGY